MTKDPNCILLQTRASDKYALAKDMNAFYQHQLSINTWGGPLNILECTPKGVNKAFALDYLLKIMNRDKKDLIAFGDEHNDTEMLAFAGKGYAMKMPIQSYSLMQMSKFPLPTTKMGLPKPYKTYSYNLY